MAFNPYISPPTIIDISPPLSVNLPECIAARHKLESSLYQLVPNTTALGSLLQFNGHLK